MANSNESYLYGYVNTHRKSSYSEIICDAYNGLQKIVKACKKALEGTSSRIMFDTNLECWPSYLEPFPSKNSGSTLNIAWFKHIYWIKSLTIKCCQDDPDTVHMIAGEHMVWELGHHPLKDFIHYYDNPMSQETQKNIETCYRLQYKKEDITAEMLEDKHYIYNKENNKLLKSLISVSAYNLKKAPIEEELLVGCLTNVNTDTDICFHTDCYDKYGLQRLINGFKSAQIGQEYDILFDNPFHCKTHFYHTYTYSQKFYSYQKYIDRITFKKIPNTSERIMYMTANDQGHVIWEFDEKAKNEFLSDHDYESYPSEKEYGCRQETRWFVDEITPKPESELCGYQNIGFFECMIKCSK